MNKRLPYEEELSKQLNDLPLPDEDVSWADMKRRLDEDDNGGTIIPPVRQGCLGYSLLLMGLAIVILLLMNHDKWLSNKSQKEIVSSGKVNNDSIDHKPASSKVEASEKSTGLQPFDITTKNFDTIAYDSKHHLIKGSLKTVDTKDPEQQVFRPHTDSINKYAKPVRPHANNRSQKNITDKYIIKDKDNQRQSKKTRGSLNSKISGNDQDTASSTNYHEDSANNKQVTTIHEPGKIDSITKKPADSSVVKKKIQENADQIKKVKAGSSLKHPIYFTAGLALHQQLPVNGQKLVPYNSLGRKSTLRDYIPSIYFRMYKDKKWFLQSEFRYGAPQYTKDIVYVQKKVLDTFTRSTLDTSNHLKKTYYHQLPVSFNYFVLPHFSVGFGVIWNRFSSAVSEQEIKRTSNITLVDSIITKTILPPQKADSNFAKSYFQALIETQCQWKRWSFGGRYSFGLQPYIRFQLPGGQHREEKNSSLEIFIRYDLWESRKK